MKTALITGSFDPVTFGHLDIFERAAKVFDKVLIGVGHNPSKQGTFTIEERMRLIRSQTKAANSTVIQIPADRLTADIAYENNAVLIKGVRMNGADFDYERLLHEINQAHQAGLETMVMSAAPHLDKISSSAAKEVCKLNGVTEDFVPLEVKSLLEFKLLGQLRVGFTGTIGAGKSTIAGILAAGRTEDGAWTSPLTVHVHNIDLDTMAHDILFDRTEPVYVSLRETLQNQWQLPEWTRKSIGGLVFTNEQAMRTLNQAMEIPLRTRLRAALNGKKGIILFNGALLIESGWTSMVNNHFIILDVDKQEQDRRLAARGLDPRQRASRLAAQYTTQRKLHELAAITEKTHFHKTAVISTSPDAKTVATEVAATLQTWWDQQTK